MDEKKGFMIIERCLSPPHSNPNEVIYAGPILNLSTIPSTLNLDKKEDENYYYNVSRAEIDNGKIRFYTGTYSLLELTFNGDNRYNSCVSLPLSPTLENIAKLSEE